MAPPRCMHGLLPTLLPTPGLIPWLGRAMQPHTYLPIQLLLVAREAGRFSAHVVATHSQAGSPLARTPDLHSLYAQSRYDVHAWVIIDQPSRPNVWCNVHLAAGHRKQHNIKEADSGSNPTYQGGHPSLWCGSKAPSSRLAHVPRTYPGTHHLRAQTRD